MKKISCLLLSSQQDFTTDYIAYELSRRRVDYLRLNRDSMHEYKVVLNISKRIMNIQIENICFEVSEEYLHSVYYRAPTFLRETFSSAKSPEEQLASSQWMALYRNLTFFSKASWVNSPNTTFVAENKLVQLKIAEEIGFTIPQTIVGNYPNLFPECTEYVVKSLDTALIRHDAKHESFAFTSIISAHELMKSDFTIAPVIIQNQLEPKIDYRVTVVGERVFVVKIVRKGKGIIGDWRKYKDDVEYEVCELPQDIKLKCIKLLKVLDLKFGAIDIAYCCDRFYFIEINPTGEWAWLKSTLGLKIDEAICDLLI